jgi:hypothetical protein
MVIIYVYLYVVTPIVEKIEGEREPRSPVDEELV